MSLYTHTLRVLPIHFGRETVPSDWYRGLVFKAVVDEAFRIMCPGELNLLGCFLMTKYTTIRSCL